jgi:hypothetical protein
MLDFGLQLAQARARVAADVWAAGWAEGRSLSIEGAVAEALWEKPQA